MRGISVTERIFAIKDILEMYSDENHELTVQDIINYLNEEYDLIDFHKDTIRKDLNKLGESNYFNLITYQEKTGLPIKYSHQERLFEIHELRILLDAIASARFITKQDKQEIIMKLKKMTSVHLAGRLDNQLHMNDYSHSKGNKVKYSIYYLHEALQQSKKVAFKYGKYNVEKEFILSKQGAVRVFYPYALFWNNDYYYLIGVEEGDLEKKKHFRVDRMEDVEVLGETFEIEKDFDVVDYTNKLFHMYAGHSQTLEVEFKHHLINVMIDRFGTDVNIKDIGNDTFLLRTNAIMSKGLVRWMLTWGSDAKVIWPVELIQDIKKESKKLFKLYNT